ncbi:MAG: methyltransferase [Oscillospiraceae bacterium]|nr:methyltransferase [Candidatus Equicaccousia limihippi]
MEKNITASLLPLGCGKSIYVSAAHTFGTDAVLLSNFAAPKRKDRALDIGTGCGIIPFLWLRDNPDLDVSAAEIQKEGADLCKMTAEKFGLPLKIFNIDIRENGFEKDSFDLITCNPPYKTETGGLVSPTTSRALQRHELTLTLCDLAAAAKSLLRFGGRLCVCIRTERFCETVATFENAGLAVKRVRTVAKNPKSEPSLCLIEAKKGAKQGVRIAPTLFTHNSDGTPTAEMAEIYKEIREQSNLPQNGEK